MQFPAPAGRRTALHCEVPHQKPGLPARFRCIYNNIIFRKFKDISAEKSGLFIRFFPYDFHPDYFFFRHAYPRAMMRSICCGRDTPASFQRSGNMLYFVNPGIVLISFT